MTRSYLTVSRYMQTLCYDILYNPGRCAIVLGKTTTYAKYCQIRLFSFHHIWMDTSDGHHVLRNLAGIRRTTERIYRLRLVFCRDGISVHRYLPCHPHKLSERRKPIMTAPRPRQNINTTVTPQISSTPDYEVWVRERGDIPSPTKIQQKKLRKMSVKPIRSGVVRDLVVYEQNLDEATQRGVRTLTSTTHAPVTRHVIQHMSILAYRRCICPLMLTAASQNN